MGKNVIKRLEDIRDSDNLGILMKIPQAGCHPLKHGRKGQWAVKVGGKERLIFEPADDDLTITAGSEIDIDNVTRVKILEVALDYHDRKDKRRKKK